MKLTGVMIGSENPKALAEFYTKFLGKPGWEQDDWYGYSVDGGTLMIGPHSEVKGKSTAPARLMISIESKDVKADAAAIKATGAEVVAEPYNPAPDNDAIWLATFADPDGNYFQLASPWEE